MPQPLPLFATFASAFDLLWKNRLVVGQAVFFAGMVKGIAVWLAFDAFEPMTATWAQVLLSLFVYTLLAIAVHRQLLQPEKSFVLSQWPGFGMRFLGWVFALYLCFSLSLFGVFQIVEVFYKLPPGFYTDWGKLALLVIGGLPGAYLGARIAVLLPSAALGLGRRVAWAWSLTRGNGWRLVMVLWLLPLIVSKLIPNFSVENPALYVLLSIAVSAVTAFEVALLSVVFREMGGLDTPTQTESVTV